MLAADMEAFSLLNVCARVSERCGAHTRCSQENGAGVEILENKPTTHPTMGDGIYTLKHYHIDRRFPGWLRAIAPKVPSRVRVSVCLSLCLSLSLSLSLSLAASLAVSRAHALSLFLFPSLSVCCVCVCVCVIVNAVNGRQHLGMLTCSNAH
jgi:hypothetical protein